MASDKVYKVHLSVRVLSRLCVVVPTYNEAENLPRLVGQIEETLRGLSFELIVVDDSSPDGTARVAEHLNAVHGNILVKSRRAKSGLGSAIQAGLRAALEMDDVENILTLDADLSHDPGEIPRLLRASEQADLVQGSRYVEDGRIVGWSFMRSLVSCVANLFCRMLLRMSMHDCRVTSESSRENALRQS